MRSGAGLVTLGIPQNLNSAIIKIKPKEVMTFPLPQTREGTLSLGGYKKINDFIKNVDVVVIGPGISRNRSTQSLARKVISKIVKPIVIDADGINALAGHLNLLEATCPERSRGRGSRLEAEYLLTPHPGEMSRLTGISIRGIQSNRKEVAKRFARAHKITLVLKGHKTIVAGNENNLYINRTGNPGMSTAGSGDVLSGMIAAFLGQGLSAFEAAKYAVYLHGLAGDLAAEEKTQISLIASDIIAKIPEAIKRSS